MSASKFILGQNSHSLCFLFTPAIFVRLVLRDPQGTRAGKQKAMSALGST